MKTILVPTDFSINAATAVKYAFAYAEATKSKIVLFHSYENPTAQLNIPMAGIQYGQQEARQNAEVQMKKLAASMLKKFPDVKLKWNVEPGAGSNNIVEYVKQYQVDLIIMGTTGQGAITRALIGSTTSYVITNAPCSIIAVPHKARFKGIKKIGIATDLEKDSLATTTEVVSFAKHYNAEAVFVHIQDLNVFDVESALQGMIDTICKQLRYKNVSYFVHNNSSIADGLDFFVKKQKPDMLAMATYGRKFPETLWKSDWTNKVANHTLVPLLVLHTKKK